MRVRAEFALRALFPDISDLTRVSDVATQVVLKFRNKKMAGIIPAIFTVDN